MHCQVASRFKHCLAGDRIILLDVQCGRYRGLPPAKEQSLAELLGQDGRCDPYDAEVQSLLSSGIIEEVEGPSSRPRPASIERPTHDLTGLPASRSSVFHVLRALAWEGRIALALAITPFSRLMQRLEAGATRVSGCTPNGHLIHDFAAAFHRAAYLSGRRDRCLVRSIAMFSLLRAFGVATQLVIGVRSSPFTAHCWVQHGGTVLNDTAEHARGFTPIWVIE